MKILLISVNNEAGVETPLPLGLACVAAATEKAGHEGRLLALTSTSDWESAIRDRIGEFRPDIIGISVRNIDDQNMQASHFFLEPFRKVVAVCRSASRAAVVLGSAGYSTEPVVQGEPVNPSALLVQLVGALCEIGAMPPFGNMYGMAVLVDESLAKDKEIAFNAGSHNELVRLSYDDFEQLVKPTVLKFSGLRDVEPLGAWHL